MTSNKKVDKEKSDISQRSLKRRRMEPKFQKPRKVRKQQLPRPKRSITFSLPQHIIDSQVSSVAELPSSLGALAKNTGGRSRSSTPSINQATNGKESPLLRLSRILILLNAIHRRNKNQHRNQPFYCHLSFLRRSVSKLIVLHEQATAIPKLTTKPSTSSPHLTTAASVREKFEKESRLRSQREVLEEHIRESVVPPAYVAFSGVVADTQFANLGIVLLGILADVAGIVGLMRRIEEIKPIQRARDGARVPKRSQIGGRLLALSTVITGPDQGMVVERVYDSDTDGMVIEATMQNSRFSQIQDEMVVDLGEVIPRDEINQAHSRIESTNNRENTSKNSEDPKELSADTKGTSILSTSEDGDGAERLNAEKAENMPFISVAALGQNNLSFAPLPPYETQIELKPTASSPSRNGYKQSQVHNTNPPLKPSKKRAPTATAPTTITKVDMRTANTTSSSTARTNTARVSEKASTVSTVPGNRLSIPTQQNPFSTKNNSQNNSMKQEKHTLPSTTSDVARWQNKETLNNQFKNSDKEKNAAAKEGTKEEERKTKTKTKRKKNVIDDLFSGFG